MNRKGGNLPAGNWDFSGRKKAEAAMNYWSYTSDPAEVWNKPEIERVNPFAKLAAASSSFTLLAVPTTRDTVLVHIADLDCGTSHFKAFCFPISGSPVIFVQTGDDDTQLGRCMQKSAILKIDTHVPERSARLEKNQIACL